MRIDRDSPKDPADPEDPADKTAVPLPGSPIPPGAGLVLDPRLANARALFQQTLHGRPLMGGYIARIPRRIVRAFEDAAFDQRGLLRQDLVHAAALVERPRDQHEPGAGPIVLVCGQHGGQGGAVCRTERRLGEVRRVGLGAQMSRVDPERIGIVRDLFEGRDDIAAIRRDG